MLHQFEQIWPRILSWARPLTNIEQKCWWNECLKETWILFGAFNLSAPKILKILNTWMRRVALMVLTISIEWKRFSLFRRSFWGLVHSASAPFFHGFRNRWTRPVKWTVWVFLAFPGFWGRLARRRIVLRMIILRSQRTTSVLRRHDFSCYSGRERWFSVLIWQRVDGNMRILISWNECF